MYTYSIFLRSNLLLVKEDRCFVAVRGRDEYMLECKLEFIEVVEYILFKELGEHTYI